MDYKYIEQLLERYWDCQTSLEEEQILRSFFNQEDVPAQLRQYIPLFAYTAQCAEETLGEDFDERMMQLIQPAPVKARVVSLKQRVAPFFKAAAVVAITLTIGNAADSALGDSPQDEQTGVPTFSGTYIKSDDVPGAVKIVDHSQAETTTQSDSLKNIQ